MSSQVHSLTQAREEKSESDSPRPRHVAIIMDGNGRWARRRGMVRLMGHRAGTENLRKIVDCFSREGVEYLTLYTFSTENWQRPSDEINGLMQLMEEVVCRETKELHRRNIRINHLGRLEHLSSSLQSVIRDAIALTEGNTGMTLSVAFNYGGRQELIEAIQQLIRHNIPPDEITEEVVSHHLYTHDLPDPDLVIRTAGEMRLSNFLLWQAAYAEYYTTPTLWPDFGATEIQDALTAFGQRHRKFGTLDSES